MTYHAKVIAGGKIVIPAILRRELGIKDGDSVSFDRAGSTIVVRSYADTVRDGSSAFRAMISELPTVDDFIADRRADAARD